MNSNLDVWAIQTLPEELITALDNIKTDNDLILYTNLFCLFNIGDTYINSRQFDTMLYSEENDILVLLMSGGQATADDIRNYLENKNFKYSEVVFKKHPSYNKDDLSIPEIWFARDINVVDDALADSVKRNSPLQFNYYPFLPGRLSLWYSTNPEQEAFTYQIAPENFKIDGRRFRGLIILEDKIILLIKPPKQNSVSASEINEVAKKYGFNVTVLENSDFKISQIEHKTLKKTPYNK